MVKGAYRTVPTTSGDVELMIQQESDESADSPWSGDSPHKDEANRRLSASAVITYSLLSVALFILLIVTIVWFPDYVIITDSSSSSSQHESIVHPNEPHQTPPMSNPGLDSAPAHDYVGPLLPDVIKTCPSLAFFQELFYNVSQGTTSYCDDAGKKRKCNCLNPTLAAKHKDDWMYVKQWDKTFQRNIHLVQQYASSTELDVLLIGDSLTEHWLGTDLGGINHEYDSTRQVYQEYFQNNDTTGLALGIGGDKCPQLLYRLQHGELIPSATKVIWINIGTNDVGADHCNVPTVVAGNMAVVEYVLSVIDPSKTRVVLNSLLPRSGRTVNDTNLEKDRNWQQMKRINQYLECYAHVRDNSAFEFFNSTNLFVSRDDSNNRNASLYHDPVHLSGNGYRIWGQAIVTRVQEIKMELSTLPLVVPLCTENHIDTYYDDLVDKISNSLTNRCNENQLCQCPDPQIPTKSESKLHGRWEKSFIRNQHQLISYLETNSTVELLLMGDSITELWLGTVLGNPSSLYREIPAVFQEIFSKESTVAMGISADQSPQLLYRIQNGELPLDLDVSVVWMLIGTNDLNGGCNADAIAAANIIIAKEIMRRQPKATIVINSLLPRMDKGEDVIPLVNMKLKCFAESMESSVSFFDATNLFVYSNGTTNTDLYTDGVHPNKQGYEIWGRAIKTYKDALLSR